MKQTITDTATKAAIAAMLLSQHQQKIN
jgi:hypothetical protein